MSVVVITTVGFFFFESRSRQQDGSLIDLACVDKKCTLSRYMAIQSIDVGLNPSISWEMVIVFKTDVVPFSGQITL
jgi:hypothetical protein